ncbi:MAG TPA: beta-N-acetylhexosaminidase [Terriglobia bacterium]|nr:beta-N-acetylhexosaminidase [Terriglobia bacterium]
MKVRLIVVLILLTSLASARPLPTDLFLRGHSVLPAPQMVQLRPEEVSFDGTWSCDSSRLVPNHIALKSLLKDLKDFYSIDLKRAASQSRKSIVLSVAAGTVKAEGGPEIVQQAYRLTILPDRIDVVGNSDQGLFYGVQTLLQLYKPTPSGTLVLPAGTIEDWPVHNLRFLHWDTKHHQDRMETLKRYLDWSARFKVNMIGFELEDKFEYPSHPVIGAPGAFTTAQLQEIVDYGLERYIQVVPQIQAPAHLAYVLKHPEFADLRADGSNYQACLCDPRTYDLIFSMYDDVIKATKGVRYFFVSTDEVYYAGICSKCDKPYNPENRSLKWVEFVQKARDFLAQRNRQMLAWVEYPFLFEHTQLLPKDVINGVLGTNPREIRAEIEHGIRHLAYTSLQGEELLFPNNFSYLGKSGLAGGRLDSVFEEISERTRPAKPIGVYGAAWDDSGLHSETFWLGWATVAQYGWSPDMAPVEQTITNFMNIYYGPSATSMVEVYQSMQRQARFFEQSWDRIVSRVRAPGYGNSNGKGIGTTRYDWTLPVPALPQLPGLEIVRAYGERYQERLKEAEQVALENDGLKRSLFQNMLNCSRNRYNLEVFLSLADLTGHQARLLMGLKRIEDNIESAHRSALRGNPEEAVGNLVSAYERAQRLVAERKATFAGLQATWEKSRYPKGQEVNGRKFTHILDDVKDHFADRRSDLTYMIAPEESIGLDKWMDNLKAIIQAYLKRNNLPERPLEELRLEED